MENLIAFIGFGEAAFHIANGLKSEGLDKIVAYDVNQDHEKFGAIIRKRAEEAGITLVETLEAAYSNARLVASLTSAKVAYQVAKSVIPNLSAGQVFIDMNATSPTVKHDIGNIQRVEGVQVCDAAIMSTVPGNGHRVEIFLSGEGADTFYSELSKYGMKLSDLNAPLGGSSAIKMFRSVFMKGLPQLMIESMYPALKFGALDALVTSINESLYGKTLDELANMLVARTMVHAGRRAKEMEEVVATLESMGIDASMSMGAKIKLEQLSDMNLIDVIGPEGKMNYKDAIAVLNERREDKHGNSKIQ